MTPARIDRDSGIAAAIPVVRGADAEIPPRLVIVSGAPASGKTTLAAILARELGLPLLAKDAIKEILTDSLGVPDALAGARALGGASFALLAAVAGWLVAGGAGAVVEANYRRGQNERGLQPIVARARAVLIHCQAPPETILRRYAARAASGGRHPVHRDAELLTQIDADLAGGHYEPLDLAIPTLRVDTRDGYDPAVDHLLRVIRASGMPA